MDHFVAERLNCRDEQFGVGAKVIVEGAARDARGRNNVFDHRGVNSLFSEDKQGAFDKLAAHARPPLGRDPRPVINGDRQLQHFRLLRAGNSTSQKFFKLTLAS